MFTNCKKQSTSGFAIAYKQNGIRRHWSEFSSTPPELSDIAKEVPTRKVKDEIFF